MGRRFLRAALRLVPSPWRQSVGADVADQASSERRGPWWMGWQVLRVGLPLRWSGVTHVLATDVRQTTRSLVRSPAFTAAAILSFALGIGANVALLSVIDRLVFRPLPFAEPDRLVVAYGDTPSGDPVLWHSQALALQDRSRTLEGLAIAYGADEAAVIDGLGEAPVRLGAASANLLSVLRVRPIAGRDFAPDAAESGARDVRELLITDALWASRFGRAPDVIDTVVGTDALRYRIVGVLPADFVNPSPQLSGRLDGLVVRNARVEGPPRDRTTVGPRVARLAAGTTLADARAEVDAIASRVAAEHPGFMGLDQRIQVAPLRTAMLLPYGRFLWLIIAAAVLVLTVACANVSTLLVARGRSRLHESAIRSSLGASRARLVVTRVGEAVVVCLGGGVAALLVLSLFQPQLLSIVPAEFQGFAVSAGDPRLVVLTFALAVASAAIAAATPAWFNARLDPRAALQGSGHTERGRRLTGGGLLAVEAALAIVLVAGGGAAVRSFAQLMLRDPGFDAPGLYRASVYFEPDRQLQNMERVRAIESVREALDAVPLVEAWTAVTYPPVVRGQLKNAYWSLLGRDGGIVGVTETTFDVLGARLLAGRGIVSEDVRTAAPVAIVNQRAAAVLWPDAPLAAALGQALTMPYGGIRDVVGVVSDIRPRPGVQAWPMLYVPLGDGMAAKPGWAMELPVLFRMPPGVRPDGASLRAAFRAIIPTGTVGEPVAVTDELEPWLVHPRFQAGLFGALGVIALLLAAVGLYAAVTFDVARRYHETGVRVALGATAGDIRREVVGGAVRPVLVGTLGGLVAAWWAAGFLQAFLIDVDARDPGSLVLVATVLLATSVVAAWLPAQRAAHTDPARVLRST